MNYLNNICREELIVLDGKVVNYSEWSLNSNSGKKITLCIKYPSGRCFYCSYKDGMVFPNEKKDSDLIYDNKNNKYSIIHSICAVGYKYYIVKFENNENSYIYEQSQLTLRKANESTTNDIYQYFKQIAQERLTNAKTTNDKIMAEIIVNQFNKIIPCDDTVLSAYICRKVFNRGEIKDYIFPFGVNESQMQAVKRAFQSQVSIIEGPPGTGKTQTILNIIANIIINGKNCAVVSNNNDAVKNVYDKMRDYGLDFLVAKLGKSKNKSDFFDNLDYKIPYFELVNVTIEEIKKMVNEIEELLSLRNKLAELQGQIYEIEIEKRYLDDWISNQPGLQVDYVKKYKISREKYIELSAYIKYIEDRELTFKDKWNLLFRYKVFSSKFLRNIGNRENFIVSLQYTFYEELFEIKSEELKNIENKLFQARFEDMLNTISEKSLLFLRKYIYEFMPDKVAEFTKKNYTKKFQEFISYFPVIGSSTHSLLNSIPSGYLLDYVIIDEASQQDIVPGVLCLGCARNVIIVGDKKQLSHIATPSKFIAPNPLYDCTKLSLLDSVGKVFCNSIQSTMLKEHYRCHPKIIQFCNKQFYNGELIPMKSDDGEDAVALITTSAGNHMRNYKNYREIESILETDIRCGYLSGDDTLDNRTVGFISPYNGQVNLANEMLPDDIVEKTIHKFQGRDCDEIYFSAVLDKKQASKRMIDFVDNAEMVNVAVSRAKDRFTLVCGKDVFLHNNKYIAALIRYIEYYGEEDSIIKSPVISAFDLLYSEYDSSLERLAKLLNPMDSKYRSEQIVAAILREVLSINEFGNIKFHMQVYLKQLVSSENMLFTESEKAFIKNRASCDFVLYYEIGKKPFAVIEVDGGYHEHPEQIVRDRLKNSILEKSRLKLLRLKTVEGNIERKIVDFVRSNM